MNGNNPGALISKLFITTGCFMTVFGPDTPTCQYPILKWQYSLWFFIFALIWDRNREHAEFRTRILRLMVGVWCVYPIIFLTSLVGVWFFIGIKANTPQCIDSKTTTSVLVLITVGFTLSIFFWGGILYLLCKFACKILGKVIPPRLRPRIRMRFFGRRANQAASVNKMTEEELETFKTAYEFEISQDSIGECKEDSPSTECSICFAELKVGQKALKLACEHFFHTDCVAEWLKRQNRCPLCKKRADGQSLQEHPEEDEAVRNFLEFQTILDNLPADTGAVPPPQRQAPELAVI